MRILLHFIALGAVNVLNMNPIWKPPRETGEWFGKGNRLQDCPIVTRRKVIDPRKEQLTPSLAIASNQIQSNQHWWPLPFAVQDEGDRAQHRAGAAVEAPPSWQGERRRRRRLGRFFYWASVPSVVVALVAASNWVPDSPWVPHWTQRFRRLPSLNWSDLRCGARASVEIGRPDRVDHGPAINLIIIPILSNYLLPSFDQTPLTKPDRTTDPTILSLAERKCVR